MPLQDIFHYLEILFVLTLTNAATMDKRLHTVSTYLGTFLRAIPVSSKNGASNVTLMQVLSMP